MDIMELLAGRRTYRRFYQKPVPQDVLDDIAAAARLSSCARNGQNLRLVVTDAPADIDAACGMVHWAAALPPELGVPKKDERPTLLIALVRSADTQANVETDAGILLANITLAAWAKGVGSCILGNIDRTKLSALFALAPEEKLLYLAAFGYPSHKSTAVPVPASGSLNYYLDENRNYCVPKRPAAELMRHLHENK
jgi:FMN reductase [NAD(P)H]